MSRCFSEQRPALSRRHARWGRLYFQQFFGATGVVDQTRLAVGRRTGDATSRVRVKEHGLVLCLPVGQAYPSLTVLCSERERPFFVPSPANRFPERAEGVKGPKR